jgi:hypothetical protein
MDIGTGRLVRDIEQINGVERENVRAIPRRLRKEAAAALGDADETFVDLDDGGKLAEWAERERKKRAKKAKRKKQLERSGRRAARKGRR